MKAKNKKTTAKSRVPFYASLLTRQEMQKTIAGGTSVLKDMVQTMKYPSDGDESTPTTDSIDS